MSTVFRYIKRGKVSVRRPTWAENWRLLCPFWARGDAGPYLTQELIRTGNEIVNVNYFYDHIVQYFKI